MTRTAAFIPDSLWKEERRSLQVIFETPMDSPFDVVLTIRDRIHPFFGLFASRLENLGINRHALNSVQARVETQLAIFDKLASTYSALDRELENYPYPIETVEDELGLSIATEIGTLFKKDLPTFGKAIKVQWVIESGSIMQLAKKLAAKATPEEREAILESRDNFSSAVLAKKYAFQKRVGLEGAAKKLIKKVKVDRDFLGWFEFTRGVLENVYTQKGLEANNDFDEFHIGNLKVIVVDPNVKSLETHFYIKQVNKAYTLLKSKGFGNLWYGTIFLKSKQYEEFSPSELQRYKDLGYDTLENAAGTYHSGTDIVVLTAPSWRAASVIVHEMGHRYWFKRMKPEQRARFNGLVQTNPSKRTRDFPSGPSEDGVLKPVTPVNDYGASSVEEAFASVFEHYVLGEDMNRDQLESFRSVLAARVVARFKAAGQMRVDPEAIESWRKDLKLMTKIYKSIGDEDNDRNQDLWNEARFLFGKFKNNFNEWVYKRVLPPGKDKTSLAKQVRTDAWSALHVISDLFPTKWDGRDSNKPAYISDFSKFKNDRERNIRKYQAAFNKAFKSLEEFLAEGVDRYVDEQHHIAGMNVRILGYGRGEEEDDVDTYLRQLQSLADAVNQKGFSKATKGMQVVLNFTPGSEEGLTAAKYTAETDTMTVYPLGIIKDTGTFAHETGHRFWFKNMSEGARARWEETIAARGVKIEKSDVEAYLKYFLTLQKDGFFLHPDEIKRDIERQNLDLAQEAKFKDLTKIMPPHPFNVNEFRRSLENYVGDTVLLEEISDYAASGGPVEAFAEAFKFYVTHGPRKLKPFTLQLFRDVVSTGGVRLATARAEAVKSIVRQRLALRGVS